MNDRYSEGEFVVKLMLNHLPKWILILNVERQRKLNVLPADSVRYTYFQYSSNQQKIRALAQNEKVISDYGQSDVVLDPRSEESVAHWIRIMYFF